MTSETRGILRLVAVGFFIFCAGFLVLAAPFWWQQWQVLKTWPAVDAEVVRSEVIPVTANGKTGYDMLLEFRFTEAERVVTSIYKSRRLSSKPESKQAAAARFPVGSRVRILHQPGNPGKVRLDPGFNLRFFAIPALITALATGCALVGGIVLYASRSAAKQS